MATNLIKDTIRALSLAASDPATPSSGGPVRVGQMTGVAVTDEGDGGNASTDTSIDMGPAVYDLSVKGIDDDGNSAVSVGDQIYYVDADTPKLSKKQAGYFFGFALEAVNSGSTDTIHVLVVPNPGPGTADILSGAIGTSELAAEAVTLAKMADLAQGSIISGQASNRPAALDAKTDGQILVGDGTDLNSVAVSGDATLANDGTVTINALDGSNVANVANDQVLGGLLVVHPITVAGGAAGNEDVTVTEKFRIIDAWAQHTGGAGEASDTIQVFNGANAVTDAMDWSGADNAIVRAGTIDDAYSAVAASGTLRVTTTDNDAGGDVGAGIVYVLGIKVA